MRDWMLENIPEGPTLYPKEQVSEQPEKFFVSEIMRERVFELYDQEIPYATQVLPPLHSPSTLGARERSAAALADLRSLGLMPRSHATVQR